MSDNFGTNFGSENGVARYTNDADRDRRSEERRGERLQVRFFDPTKTACYSGILINGSNGGAFIETTDTLPLLTEIRIEGPGIVCHARICRVHWLRPDERSIGISGMAVILTTGRNAIVDADYETENGSVLSFGAALQAT